MGANTQIQERKEEAQLLSPFPEASLLREQTQALLELYKENRTHVRHHEAQRSTVTNIVLLTTVGLMGLIGELTFKDWPLTLALILVGLFGAAFNANQIEHVLRYKARARKYYEALDESLFQGTARLGSLREEADLVHTSKFSRSRKITQSPLIRILWPLGISIIASGFMIYMYFWMPHDR